jgi:hypothetical protein
MALPKIQHPTYDVSIPSNKQKVKMRPMLIKEEKILLIAKQSGEENSIIEAMKQVINNCVVTKSFDINKLTMFDLEFLFLKLTSFSVSNIVKVSYQDSEDEKNYDFEIDLDTIEVDFPEVNSTIELGNDIVMELTYPPMPAYTKAGLENMDEGKLLNHFLRHSIEKLFEGDTAHDIKSSTEKDFNEFVDSIPSKQYKEIQEFLNSQPHLHHEIKYKNENGTEREIVLSTLNDFFTF